MSSWPYERWPANAKQLVVRPPQARISETKLIKIYIERNRSLHLYSVARHFHSVYPFMSFHRVDFLEIYRAIYDMLGTEPQVFLNCAVKRVSEMLNKE